MNAADKPILIGYDGSDSAKRAIRESAALLSSHHALVATAWDPAEGYEGSTMSGLDDTSLELIDMSEAEEVDDELQASAQKTAKEGAELAASLGWEAEPVVLAEAGKAAEAIVELARKRDVAAIVVGSRGRRGFLARLEGSTSKGVLKDAPCPVVVVHED